MNDNKPTRQLSGNMLAAIALGGTFAFGALGIYLAVHLDSPNWLAMWIPFFALILAG